MKNLCFIHILFLAGCFLASCISLKRSPGVARATPLNDALVVDRAEAISQEKRDQLRTEEIVKAYPIGRYVESGSGRVMHEKHTVYRVEEDADWNLRGGMERRGGERENYYTTPAKAAELNPGYLAALAEQNAVLERKIRTLEYDHAQCKMPLESIQPQLDHFKASLPLSQLLPLLPLPLPQRPLSRLPQHHVQENTEQKLSFRKDPFFLSQDSKPSSFSSN